MVCCVHKSVQTKGQGDTHDLSAMVQAAIESSGLAIGMASVFVRGSTAGITTMEYEPGVVHDLDAALGTLAPRDGDYRHHLRWGDDNGSSHVRAALVGPSLAVPFQHGRLLLGTWQQIVLVEFDTSPRRREVIIQLHGEKEGSEGN